MLQVAYIKQNVELVKERLAVKGFKEINLVDEIILLDDEIRHLKKRVEDAQMQINSKSN
ncbi:MAG: serine--tRNA ligase, partial [Ginsengibacter sp.]